MRLRDLGEIEPVNPLFSPSRTRARKFHGLHSMPAAWFRREPRAGGFRLPSPPAGSCALEVETATACPSVRNQAARSNAPGGAGRLRAATSRCTPSPAYWRLAREGPRRERSPNQVRGPGCSIRSGVRSPPAPDTGGAGLALAFAFAGVNHCRGATSHRPGQTLRRTASPLHLPLASVACVVVVAPSPGARIAGSVHSLRSAAVRGHGAWSVRQKVLFQLTAV